MCVRRQRCVGGDKDGSEETKVRRRRQRCVGGDRDASEETKMRRRDKDASEEVGGWDSQW